jgi:uncharacterized membrane protein
MSLKLLYAIILTILPITELRVGLPVAISYAIENSIPIFLIFTLIVLINILLVFFVFFFLDNIHKHLLKIRVYKRIFEKYLERFQKKVDKFEKKHKTFEFLALALFVGIPLPGTGAWSGCLLAWLLDLDRKKSMAAISLGVLIAGIIVLIGSLGFISVFNLF